MFLWYLEGSRWSFNLMTFISYYLSNNFADWHHYSRPYSSNPRRFMQSHFLNTTLFIRATQSNMKWHIFWNTFLIDWWSACYHIIVFMHSFVCLSVCLFVCLFVSPSVTKISREPIDIFQYPFIGEVYHMRGRTD